jgi:REP element-mobilizing transposase RayT
MKPRDADRRSIRLREFDYGSAGAYFFTIVTAQRQPLFGAVVNDAMCLSPLGEILAQKWHDTPQHRPYIELDEFVIMPNHIHGVVWLINEHGSPSAFNHQPRSYHASDPRSLSAFIRAYKSATTRGINIHRGTPGEAVWQRNYFERVIRNERELDDIRQYIIHNPARWALDHENPDRR